MTCKINADTSDGLKIVSDTSGAVDIQSNGVTKVTIDANGNVNTVGQVSTTDNGTIVTRQNAKPLIINGDMAVAQRSTSVTGVTGSGYNTCDRIRFDVGTLGTWTVIQSTDVPTGKGFANSFRVDCTTADASPAAGDFCIVSTRLEGQDVQLFKKGTSSAEKFTLSFYVKSNKTGTFIAELDDNDNSRNINQTYTISSANTWEKKVLTFDADTTGAFDNDNASSLQILWWLDGGSNFRSGSLQTAWGSTDNTKRLAGSVALGDSTDNDWSITGIQLEVGEFDSTTIPSFQHESYGDSLQRCERYCKAIIKEASYAPVMMAHGVDANTARGAYFFQTPMRSAPSFTATGDFIRSYVSAVAASSTTAVSTRFSHSIDWTVSGAFALDEGILITFKTTDASLIYDAEL